MNPNRVESKRNDGMRRGKSPSTATNLFDVTVYSFLF